MSWDEFIFFIEYLLKVLYMEFIRFLKGLKNIFRPKFWMFVFSIILIWQLLLKKSWASMVTLVVLIFIWSWDIYDAGHWRGDLRKEYYKKIKKKQEEDDKKKDL